MMTMSIDCILLEQFSIYVMPLILIADDQTIYLDYKRMVRPGLSIIFVSHQILREPFFTVLLRGERILN